MKINVNDIVTLHDRHEKLRVVFVDNVKETFDAIKLNNNGILTDLTEQDVKSSDGRLQQWINISKHLRR